MDTTQSYEALIGEAAAAVAAGEKDALQRAELLYRQALSAGERDPGLSDLSLVPALTGLGAVLMQRGVPDEAGPLLNRAAAIGEQQLGADHPDVAILINDLTRLCLKHGAHASAEPLLSRLLEIKRAKGDDHPEVATVLATTASVRQSQGRLDEAEQLWRRVVDIRERTLAPNHIATTSALEHLGMSCAARGKMDEALTQMQRALVMREAALGAAHPSVRALRERIADVQLQSSDDLFDTTVASPSARAEPRLSVAAHLPPSLTPASSPVAPPAPSSDQRTLRPAAVAQADAGVSRILVPEPSALVPANPPPLPAPSSYMDVLMDIREEIEEPAAAPAGGRSAATVAWLTSAFRERRMTFIAAAVVLLIGTGVGVAAATRDDQPRWAERGTFVPVPPAPDTSVRPTTVADVFRSVVGGEAVRDTAPASPNRQDRDRTVSDRVARDRTESDRAAAAIVIRPPSFGRLDSVTRAMNVPAQNVGEPFDVRLQASLASAAQSGIAALEAPVPARRAKLIGNPPVPRYPEQISRSGIGGEVRVRFEVDTLGRPVTSTIEILASPHPSLTASVKKVVPTMRFEPARSPGPAPRTISESVEMNFYFAPRGN